MIHHYTCQQAVYSRFIAPSKTEADFLEVNYVRTHAGIISRSSTRGPSRTQGTIHHNVPMHRTCWRGQQTTVTVISAAVMVQRSCGVPQAGRACSKAPLPHRTSRCHALAEGRMVFSGRQQCRGLRQGQGNAGISENKVDEIRTRRMKVPKKKKVCYLAPQFLFHLMDCRMPRDLQRETPLLSLFTFLIPSKYWSIFQPYHAQDMHACTVRDSDVNWRLFYIWSFCAPLSSSLSSLKKCTLHLHIDEKLSQHWMREHGSVLGDWMRTSCWQQVRIPHWSWLVAIPRCLPDTTPFEFQMHQYKRAGSRIKRVGLKKKKKKYLY